MGEKRMSRRKDGFWTRKVETWEVRESVGEKKKRRRKGGRRREGEGGEGKAKKKRGEMGTGRRED